MGALTENHRCPRGRFSRVIQALSTVGVGSVAGALMVFGLIERPTGALVLAGAALGGVLASALRQAVSPRV
jgi:uncharacterized protein with ACT and thioredoxin-like domain